VDFDLPDGGRGAEATRGAGHRGPADRPGRYGQPGPHDQHDQHDQHDRAADFGRDERRTRRGSGFLASDEPFAVHCDDVPPVLGLPDTDEHRW
jgi:hypothetical protein